MLLIDWMCGCESFWAGDNGSKIIYKGSLHFIYLFLIFITINYLSFYIRILVLLTPSSVRILPFFSAWHSD